MSIYNIMCENPDCDDVALQYSSGPEGNRYFRGCMKHYANEKLGTSIKPGNTNRCMARRVDGSGKRHVCLLDGSHSGEHVYQCGRPGIMPGIFCELEEGHEIEFHQSGETSWHKSFNEALPAETFNPIRPNYYHGTVVDDFIEEFKLSFRLGSVIKYVARHQHKDRVKDLEKASWYLNREILRLGGKAAFTDKE